MPQGWLTALPAILLATILTGGLVGLAYLDYAKLNQQPPKIPSTQKIVKTERLLEKGLASSINISNLFGNAKTQTSPVIAELPETHLNLTLMGTFTHQESSSQSALISTQKGAAVRYYLAEEVAPGTKIITIEPGIVTLRRNGQDEILKLPLLSDKRERAPTVSQHLPQPTSANIIPSATGRTHQNSQVANERKSRLKARLEKLRTQQRKN